eukprot:4756490-Prymnesium_polylepis.1
MDVAAEVRVEAQPQSAFPKLARPVARYVPREAKLVPSHVRAMAPSHGSRKCGERVPGHPAWHDPIAIGWLDRCVPGRDHREAPATRALVGRDQSPCVFHRAPPASRLHDVLVLWVGAQLPWPDALQTRMLQAPPVRCALLRRVPCSAGEDESCSRRLFRSSLVGIHTPAETCAVPQTCEICAVPQETGVADIDLEEHVPDTHRKLGSWCSVAYGL